MAKSTPHNHNKMPKSNCRTYHIDELDNDDESFALKANEQCSPVQWKCFCYPTTWILLLSSTLELCWLLVLAQQSLRMTEPKRSDEVDFGGFYAIKHVNIHKLQCVILKGKLFQ